MRNDKLWIKIKGKHILKKALRQRQSCREDVHILEHMDTARGALLRRDYRTADVHIAIAEGMILTGLVRESRARRKKERRGKNV